MAPSDRATSSRVASEVATASSASADGGGFDDESWGVRRSNASTNSAVASVASVISTAMGRDYRREMGFL